MQRVRFLKSHIQKQKVNLRRLMKAHAHGEATDEVVDQASRVLDADSNEFHQLKVCCMPVHLSACACLQQISLQVVDRVFKVWEASSTEFCEVKVSVLLLSAAESTCVHVRVYVRVAVPTLRAFKGALIRSSQTVHLSNSSRTVAFVLIPGCSLFD